MSRRGETFVHVVALWLDPQKFPDRLSFAEILPRIAKLGPLDNIELSLAPEGGGRLGFILQRDIPTEALRAVLASIAGENGVLDCRVKPW